MDYERMGFDNMQYTWIVQTDADPTRSVRSLLSSHIQDEAYSHVFAAMAYVTVAGIRSVLGLLKTPPLVAHWLIGLDDAVTQPGAIDLCKTLSGSHVRIASFEHEYRRFHPKILYLCKSDVPEAFMMLGSANLTKAALCGNAESVIILRTDTPADKAELDQLWRTAWKLGRALSADELESYREKYKKSKKYQRQAMKARKRAPGNARSRTVRLVLDDDNAEIDPATATTCWIECGNVTAMGRELEFKAEQGLFFGLNPHGEAPKHLKYVVSDGQEVQLRMKYQDNHMWRLQMTRDVPEVARGLRPVEQNGKLGRSPWVAVFTRNAEPDTYVLTFVRLDSKAHRALRQRSLEKGSHGTTTAREYGWF